MTAPGIFLHAYWQKIGILNQDALEAHPIGFAILEFMRNKKVWEGTSSELLLELEGCASDLRINVKSKEWPSNPTWLGRKINDIRGNLEDEGIKFTQIREGNKRYLKFSVFSRLAGEGVDSLVGEKKVYPAYPAGKEDILPANDTKCRLKNKIVSHTTDTEKSLNDTNDSKIFKRLEKKDILHVVESRDKGEGVFIEDILNDKVIKNESEKAEVERLIQKLLNDGVLHEPRAGRIKVL